MIGRTRETFSFQGITALVTGASSGIGECFARRLAEKGANLILVARSTDKMNALAEEIKKTYRVQAHVISADLGLPQSPSLVYDAVQKAGLQVDLLINNAGLGRRGQFEEVGLEPDEGMLRVNINALVGLTHLFLPGMLQRKKGGIMNIASTAGFQPLPFLSLYAATKAFVISFTEALWVEYHNRGIRVFCLCPGNTATEFHKVAGIDKKRAFLAALPEDLVDYGLQIFSHTNRPTAVHGGVNKVLVQFHRFSPRSWVPMIAQWLYRPMKAHQKASEPAASTQKI